MLKAESRLSEDKTASGPLVVVIILHSRWQQERCFLVNQTNSCFGILKGLQHSETFPAPTMVHKVSKFVGENEPLGNLLEAPWQKINSELSEQKLKHQLLDAFKISHITKTPELGISLKPFVLLFDEYYTESYRISEAIKKMSEATEFVFLGTSFSVGFTQIALDIAKQNEAKVIIVDPEPKNVNYENVKYLKITANAYINLQENK